MKIAPTARKIFDQQCKRTFATISAITGREQAQQKSPLLDHLVGAGKQAGEKCS
jgi:hypothetical protein